MSRIRPTFAEMMGWGQITGCDVTRNVEIPPSQSPMRRDLVKRFATLDHLGEQNIFGEAALEQDEDEEDEDALLDEHEDARFLNSQVDPLQDCPSTQDPNRFVSQNTNKKRR